jgi:predicted oxidoreductase
MKYVDVAGARVSAVGLGTWQFGSTEWGYGADYSEREAGAIVQRALDVGITLFDTAEIYGFGRSERILGKALGTGVTRPSSRRRSSRCCPSGRWYCSVPGGVCGAWGWRRWICTSCTSPIRWCR